MSNFLNSFANGFTNPGFIPEMNDKEFMYLKPRDSSPLNNNRSSRPKSSDSSWRERTIFGPMSHYKAHETYFDCEFYIYGHKYQSKLF